jgi:hypothetical protein
MANRNKPGYRSPRQKQQEVLRLHRTLMAVIRKVAAAKGGDTTVEAVIAECFGIVLPPPTRPRSRGNAAKRSTAPGH